MGVFQIAFIVFNLVVPYWLWTRTGIDSAGGVNWKTWNITMSRLIQAGGGFSCPTSEIVKQIHELCHRSISENTKTENVIFEQDLADRTLSCEARADSLSVKISAHVSKDPKAKCFSKDLHGTLSASPAFIFTLKGFVNSMSFDSSTGERQRIPVTNCRRKLKGLKNKAANTAEELENSLPRAINDPNDQKMANRFCWVYDAAPGWNVWRERFAKSL